MLKNWRGTPAVTFFLPSGWLGQAAVGARLERFTNGLRVFRRGKNDELGCGQQRLEAAQAVKAAHVRKRRLNFNSG